MKDFKDLPEEEAARRRERVTGFSDMSPFERTVADIARYTLRDSVQKRLWGWFLAAGLATSVPASQPVHERTLDVAQPIAGSLGNGEGSLKNGSSSSGNRGASSGNREVSGRPEKSLEQPLKGFEFEDKFREDALAIQKRNEPRMARMRERRDQAERFKDDLSQNYTTASCDDIFFVIEYYDQGTQEGEKEFAEENFREIFDSLELSDSKNPTHEDMQKIVSAFTPPADVTRSCATTSLAEAQGGRLGAGSCVVVAKNVVMAMCRAYPHLRNSLSLQVFGDHRQATVDVDGQRFILKDDVPAFPDKITQEEKSEVMPLGVWLALYSGHKRSEFEKSIEKYGPGWEDGSKSEQSKDYPRVTDNLIQEGFWSSGLGHVGTADDWYGAREARDTKVYEGESLSVQDAIKLRQELDSQKGQVIKRVLFDHVRKLEAKAVAELVQVSGARHIWFEFSDMELTEEASAEFDGFEGHIRLKNASFSLKAAQNLAGIRGAVSLENPVSLESLAGLDEHGDYLFISGVSQENMVHLVSLTGGHKGSLYLEISDEFPEEAGDILSRRKGAVDIVLEHGATITDSVLGKLAAVEGAISVADFLGYNREYPTSLSVETAKKLSQRSPEYDDYFTHIDTMSVEAAEELVKRKDRSINFPDLLLTPELARVFAQHPDLSFDNVPLDAAQELAKQKGHLRVDEETSLRALEELLTHKKEGTITVYFYNSITLQKAHVLALAQIPTTVQTFLARGDDHLVTTKGVARILHANKNLRIDGDDVSQHRVENPETSD